MAEHDPYGPGSAGVVHRDGRDRRGHLLTWVFGLIAIAAIGLAIWALVDDAGEPDETATVAEIAADPGEWYAERVTVVGDVGRLARLGGASAPPDAQSGDGGLLGAQGTGGDAGVAFVLEQSGEQLLVIAADAPYRYVDGESVVQVEGTVREFNEAAFANAFGVGDDSPSFDQPLFEGWEGRPVLVARSVDPTAGGGAGS